MFLLGHTGILYIHVFILGHDTPFLNSDFNFSKGEIQELEIIHRKLQEISARRSRDSNHWSQDYRYANHCITVAEYIW
jgi:hypothetical protein